MTYARRYIDVYFSGSKGSATFNARGKYALRTSARILHAGGFNYGTMELEIYGLSLEHIKQLSTYGTRFQPDFGIRVRVDAGDDINGMSTVFVGTVRQAWGDMKAMPSVPFRVLATMNIGQDGDQGNATSKRIEPSSYEGPTDVVTILRKLAGQVGMAFEDNGVKAKIADPYFWGGPWKQMKEVIDAGNIYGVIDNGVLAVWPRGGSRSGDALIISPQTGLRDYPAFTEYGVQVRYEFHRAIRYGSIMTIENSDITPANGNWQIIRIDYDLQANTPRGNWFAILDGTQLGAPSTMR